VKLVGARSLVGDEGTEAPAEDEAAGVAVEGDPPSDADEPVVAQPERLKAVTTRALKAAVGRRPFTSSAYAQPAEADPQPSGSSSRAAELMQ
jgi:hypothetical protein